MLLLLLSVGSGCADAPDDRYAQAVEAAAKTDALEDYLLFFTQSSAEMLRGADRVARSKSKDLAYLKDVRTLLPETEVDGVEIRGNLALLTLAGQDGKPIRMVQERGEWVIDATSLPRFWAPLRKEVTE
jgi:hypothetical protein